MISQEWLKIEVNLLSSVNRKSCCVDWHKKRMTLSDLEWSFHASRAISAVAELLVIIHLVSIKISIMNIDSTRDITGTTVNVNVNAQYLSTCESCNKELRRLRQQCLFVTNNGSW